LWLKAAMRRSETIVVLVLLALCGPACRCTPVVQKVEPSIGAIPVALDFGPVKVGQRVTRTLKLESKTTGELQISSVKLEVSAGTAGVFANGTAPTTIAGLSSASFEVSFTPAAVEASVGNLIIASNDPQTPTLKVPLSGEGQLPKIAVTPQCVSTSGCTGAVVVEPPSIDFGAQPLTTPVEPGNDTLPNVVITNEGQVTLTLSALTLTGPDAAAFTLKGNATVPAGGLAFAPGEGVNLPIRFKPTSAAQSTYSAQLVIASDDPAKPSVSVALRGTLRPNQPPTVCFNLIRVVTVDDGTRDYSAAPQWDPLLVPPATGYDFRVSRDVTPRSEVVFSALSKANDPAACTFDPEDGRTALTYQWRLLSAPMGAAALGISGATSPQATLRPIVTGEYTLELAVRDGQGQATVVTGLFGVAVKQDLVAQLQWSSANVDLDVHLIRPSAATVPADPFSGAFDFFSNGAANATSGDINGFAKTVRAATPAYDFNWGLMDTSDDPSLNIDDTGSGVLLENVSMNKPENDALCATSRCTYKVMVHYFNDARAASAGPCIVDGGTGCRDGEACGCAAPLRCVANGAPIGSSPLGAGSCSPPVRPVVRIFLKGSPTPARVIPLELGLPDAGAFDGGPELSAPCQLLYVADVNWPARTEIGSLPDGGTPLADIVVRADQQARFGYRQAGNAQCSPDTQISGKGWYARQP
jgi:hypothetical protein